MSPIPLELSSLKRHYGDDLAPGCCHLGHRPWQLQRNYLVGEICFAILEKPRNRIALFLECLKPQSFLESAQISYGVGFQSCVSVALGAPLELSEPLVLTCAFGQWHLYNAC